MFICLFEADRLIGEVESSAGEGQQEAAAGDRETQGGVRQCEELRGRTACPTRHPQQHPDQGEEGVHPQGQEGFDDREEKVLGR